MTPATPFQKKSKTPGEEIVEGCSAVIGLMIAFTLLCWAAWDLGLEGAGVVDNDIGIGGAFGLACLVTILRALLIAARQGTRR